MVGRKALIPGIEGDELGPQGIGIRRHQAEESVVGFDGEDGPDWLQDLTGRKGSRCGAQLRNEVGQRKEPPNGVKVEREDGYVLGVGGTLTLAQ